MAQTLDDDVKYLMKDILKYELITDKDEFNALYQQERSNPDRELRNRLILPNLRLGLKMARKYAQSYHLNHLQESDLLMEAYIALEKAYERFKPEKDVKFMSYAIWWIEQRIKRSIYDTEDSIRTPIHVRQQILHINRARDTLRERYAREPSIDEIAQHVDASPDWIAKTIRTAAQAKSTHSLHDNLYDNEEDATLIETIADEKPYQLEEITADRFHELLAHGNLQEKEEYVIKERYLEHKTLQEIGNDLDLTKERIRQIEYKAIRKLRAQLTKAGIDRDSAYK